MQLSHLSRRLRERRAHCRCCRRVTDWYHCFAVMCSVLITFLLVTTPLPSGVCGLRPAAPREVQGAFTPKITLRVPLFPLLHSLQRRRGTTCHIGVEWHRWYTRCVAGARDGRVVLVLRGPHAAALCCLGAADHASSHLCVCVRARVFLYV